MREATYQVVIPPNDTPDLAVSTLIFVAPFDCLFGSIVYAPAAPLVGDGDTGLLYGLHVIGADEQEDNWDKEIDYTPPAGVIDLIGVPVLVEPGVDDIPTRVNTRPVVTGDQWFFVSTPVGDGVEPGGILTITVVEGSAPEEEEE